ncbi:hypothetical protein CDO28_18065 [Sinorhizobium meliloti]|uniref:hypothetical protein n=1 Tax=Rhizobium meliloti TaxID=382 RepID=UPI000B49F979|nr:hypothetical protein [Sinorhizobium meliloti]ASP73276.1 hypothetical protein CDO28_18065 [Sinorhizobium meliloti]MDE3854388.1 hypothetical protein [Sinorhizobium meliloti]MQW52292.1 hypothetical protein [Sinorhizobium meliloti]
MVATPKWRFEYNLNTLVILFGFAGGLVAWGATWERVNANQESQANSIDRLDKRLTAAEVSLRQIDNHELRISAVEKQAAEAATSMKAVENTLNSLSTDTGVMREILQRIEAGQRDGAQLRAICIIMQLRDAILLDLVSGMETKLADPKTHAVAPR